ncbi:hypothetical protein [Sulfurimonas sp.]|uniref:hypothetical protein n=1 Tax=Sulfurimonas sp. TaxID=2022749 RepID=UPI0025DA9FA6|nr:hypothetical protein [Sulfurimonas sp.]MDD5157126.1 hypothetical protein [Sulfurimonas sp.]
MIKFLLLAILPFSLYASKILSYNIYEREDRVDVMITFDTPYSGVIKQGKSDSSIIIKLEDATIESEKLNSVTSNYITSLSITPTDNNTRIVAVVTPSTILSASKTSDAYGLRLRFASKASFEKNEMDKPVAQLGSLPTKKDEGVSQSYYIVITVLIAGIILLFFIKKRIATKQGLELNSSWLFNNNPQKTAKTQYQAPDIKLNNNEISIKFQKPINGENSVVLLEFGEQSYLVLIGKSNILLDKFTDNKPITEDDFNTVLQNRNKELNDFLNMSEQKKEPIQAYKERAASMLYEA